MTEQLALIAALRAGGCRHANRVNFCSACLALLEKALLNQKEAA
jgi:hypothetical protein